MSASDGNGALPGGWRQLRAGDVLKLRNGRAFKSGEWMTTGRPIIRIQNLKSEDASFNYFDGELPEQFAARSGDLLFAWSGTPGTSFGAHIWHGPDAWVNQQIFRVDFSAADFDRDFLKFALDANLASYIDQAQGGVGLAHITKSKLNDSLLLAPPVEEQRRIAERLQQITARHAATAARLNAARAIVKRIQSAVLAAASSGRLTEDWREQNPDATTDGVLALAEERRRVGSKRFVEPRLNPHASRNGLPEAWALAPLGVLLVDLKYGTSKRSAYDQAGTPVLRIPNVSTGMLDVKDLKFADIDDRERGALMLREDDLLMIRSNGSVQLVGVTAAVTPAAEGMAYAGYLMRLRADPSLLDPQFLGVILASPQLRNQIELPARSTSGVHNINTAEVRALGVPLPSLDEQREIVRRVPALLATANQLNDRIEHILRSLSRVSNASLAEAFRGELVPTEAALAKEELRPR